jgi:hypothetical protein
MVTMMPVDEFIESASEVEFFGVKLKVKSPHLAALLNSTMSDDVVLVGRRARDAVVSPNTPAAVKTEGVTIRTDGFVDLSLDD